MRFLLYSPLNQGLKHEDDLCLECAAKADAYEEIVDRVKDALSTPFDMAQMVKSILINQKEE